MTARSNRPDPSTPRPLSKWIIRIGAVVVLTAAVVVVAVSWFMLRRITELYTKAAELLGSTQVSVRMAGLYALERLAHSTVEHRQSIVDVICAHLRMPYTPPRSYRSPGPARRRRARTLTARHATPTSQGSRQENAQQEQQVRLTAQNILLRNLRVAAQSRRRWWLAHRRPRRRGLASG